MLEAPGQVKGNKETEMVLANSFHSNELRSMDFMEPGPIDLWLPSSTFFHNIIRLLTRDYNNLMQFTAFSANTLIFLNSSENQLH